MTGIHPALAGLVFATSSAVFAQSGEPVDTIPVKEEEPAAVSTPSVLSYTYVDLAYGQTQFDQTKVDADGFALSGSYQLPATLLPALGGALYATGGYSMIKTDKSAGGGSTETTDLRLGVGYRLELSNTLDMTTELDFLQQDSKLKPSGLSVDDTGFRLGVGTRAQVAPQFEASGGIRYVDIGVDSVTLLEANGLYHIAQGFAAFVTVATSSDVTSFGIGGRYNFKF